MFDPGRLTAPGIGARREAPALNTRAPMRKAQAGTQKRGFASPGPALLKSLARQATARQAPHLGFRPRARPPTALRRIESRREKPVDSAGGPTRTVEPRPMAAHAEPPANPPDASFLL